MKSVLLGVVWKATLLLVRNAVLMNTSPFWRIREEGTLKVCKKRVARQPSAEGRAGRLVSWSFTTPRESERATEMALFMLRNVLTSTDLHSSLRELISRSQVAYSNAVSLGSLDKLNLMNQRPR